MMNNESLANARVNTFLTFLPFPLSKVLSASPSGHKILNMFLKFYLVLDQSTPAIAGIVFILSLLLGHVVFEDYNNY